MKLIIFLNFLLITIFFLSNYIAWRDVENRDTRFTGKQILLDDLFSAVKLARPDDASEIPLDAPAVQRRLPKKKTTIKQLFSATSKFQKNLRR